MHEGWPCAPLVRPDRRGIAGVGDAKSSKVRQDEDLQPRPARMNQNMQSMKTREGDRVTGPAL